MPGGGPNAGQGGSYGGSGGYAPGSAPQAWSDGSMSRIASMGGAEIVTRLPESSYAAMHASNPETRQAEMQRSFPQLDTSGMTNIVADSASGSISFEKNVQQYVAFSSAEQRLSASGNDYVSGPVEHITAANGADYSVAPINSAAYAEAVQSMPGGARSNPVASMITENTPGVYNAANGPTRIPESAYEGMHSSSAQSRVAAVREAFPDMSTRGMAKVHVDSASGAFSFERGGQQYVAFSSMESQISAIGNQISTGSIQQVKAANGATYTVAQVDRDAYQQYRDNAVSAGEKPQSLAAVFTTPTRAVFSTPKVAVVPEVTTNPFVNQQNDIGSVSFRRTGRSGGGRRVVNRGTNLRVTVKLTLEEIANGTTKKIKVKKYVPCSACHGTGEKDGNSSTTCPTCNGRGVQTRVMHTMLGQMQTSSTCSACGGSGKVIKDKCTSCYGEGIVSGEETIELKIPAGVYEGMQLSMDGKGNAARHGGINGDLLIAIQEVEHPELKRDGIDLIYNLYIGIPDAILGCSAEIPTIGNKVKIKVEPGTQSGKILRLKGKGLPDINGYGHGDLLVRINVFIPNDVSKDDKKLLEQMRESESFNPQSKRNESFFTKLKNAFHGII